LHDYAVFPKLTEQEFEYVFIRGINEKIVGPDHVHSDKWGDFGPEMFHAWETNWPTIEEAEANAQYSECYICTLATSLQLFNFELAPVYFLLEFPPGLTEDEVRSICEDYEYELVRKVNQ
jgi:hypothetical protein